MPKGKARKTKEGRGNRKVRAAAGKDVRRRSPVLLDGADIDYIKNPNRWPTERQLVNYTELNMAKTPRGGGKKSNVPTFAFPLIEQAMGTDLETYKVPAVARLLRAACFTIQPVKRYPGYVLKRTDNLKGKVIDLSV